MTNRVRSFTFLRRPLPAWSGWLLLILLATAVGISLFFRLGLWDPAPVGPVQWQSQPQSVAVPAQGSQLVWLEPALPSADFSLRTAVQYQSGSLDSGVGLVLADACTAVAITLAATGYLSLQPLPSNDGCDPGIDPLPWQTWPHIRPEAGQNEIWLDWAAGELQVRINRELLWVGPLPWQPTQVGLYSQGFGQTAVYQWDALSVYAP